MHLRRLFSLVASAGLLAAYASAAPDAPALWQQHCQKCHGATGKGDTKSGKALKVRDYTSAEVQAALKDEEMFRATKEGVVENGKERMKPYKEKLTDEEITALVAYIRSLKAP